MCVCVCVCISLSIPEAPMQRTKLHNTKQREYYGSVFCTICVHLAIGNNVF
jgi:hypothetical protein